MMHAWGQEKRKLYGVLVETMKEKRPCGIPDIDGRITIKMDIQEAGCENVGCDSNQWWDPTNIEISL
jgi:hypothetical protein